MTSPVIPVADELADPLRKRSARNVSIELSKEDLRRLKAAAERMGATPREFAEHALESAIVAMEELRRLGA